MKFRRNDLKSRFKFLITWLLTACLLVYSPFGAVSVAAESDGIIMNDILDDNNSLEEPFFQIQSTTPSGITVTTPSAINYIEGISDRVTVTDLLPGDIVKVYDQATGGNILGQGTVASDETSVTIEIPQLGKRKGTVYVSVTRGGTESDRVEVDYVSEPIPWQIYGHTGNWGEDKDGVQGQKPTPVPPVYPNNDDNPAGFEYNQHIIIKENGSRVTFYGYGKQAYKDFILLPSESEAKKKITFEMDLSQVNYHSMEGAGILLNSRIDAGKLYGYAILFAQSEIQLFKINGVDVNAFHNREGTSGGGFATFNPEIGTALKKVAPATGTEHSLELEITPTSVKLTDQGKSGAPVVLNETLIPISGAGNGVGFIASHIGHDCSVLSYFSITNVSISDEEDNPYTWPLLDLTAKLSSEDPYGSVELNYTAPENAEVVILQYSTDSNFPEESTASIPLDPESAQTTVHGLKDNTKYYFRLLIGGGENGGISNTADATTQKNPNTAPTATSVSITGKLEVGQTLTGNYTYSDANGDLE
ncbi:MAG TPA: hypothetical protein GX523_12500, partial [Desulfitobacterium dehalogenans]|nr:hypothetical protein [Desulfitobacterium dehalogenans]